MNDWNRGTRRGDDSGDEGGIVEEFVRQKVNGYLVMGALLICIIAGFVTGGMVADIRNLGWEAWAASGVIQLMLLGAWYEAYSSAREQGRVAGMDAKLWIVGPLLAYLVGAGLGFYMLMT
jgi:hypothetical protein